MLAGCSRSSNAVCNEDHVQFRYDVSNTFKSARTMQSVIAIDEIALKEVILKCMISNSIVAQTKSGSLLILHRSIDDA